MIFCKLNQISFSDRQWLEKELSGFRACDGECPFCGAKGCLEKFACYDRYLIEVKDGKAATYRSYSLRFILHVLRCYFLHKKTVYALCEDAGISPSTLYEWKGMFLRQKSLWLGVLSDLEQSVTSFLNGIDGKGLLQFHGTFHSSFLQCMPRTDGEGPPWKRKAASGST